MQCQFLFNRVSPVGRVPVITVTEWNVLTVHCRNLVFTQARPLGIPAHILYHLLRHLYRLLQMYNPVLFVRHFFDEAHKLHAVMEVMLQPTRVEQPYQRIFKLVTEHLTDWGDMYIITFGNDNLSVAVNTAPRHNHVRVYMELFRFPVGMQYGNHPGFQAELVLHPVLNGFSRCAHQDIQYFFFVTLHQVQ